MAHNIVLQAYERSLQAYGHSLPHYVPVHGNHQQLERSCEESEKINKILEKLQQLENSCAEVTNGYKKISAVIYNREDEQFHKNVEKEKEEKHEKQKDKKCYNNEKAVSYAKGNSSRTCMDNSSKYIPPPMRNKGKKEEKC